MSATVTTSRPIMVGKKPAQNYALAVAHKLGEGQKSVVIRARGRYISTAMDAANMAANMGLAERATVARIGQEHGPEGKPVSFIEIELTAKASS